LTDVDLEEIRKKLSARLCEIFEKDIVDTMSWSDMDAQFSISEREKDSSGKLSLYRRLKELGFSGNDDGDED